MDQASFIAKLLEELKSFFHSPPLFKKVSTRKHLLVGKIGEDIALKYLLENNYSLEFKNWRCKQGEIDLIVRDKTYLVFVEVKTRIYSPLARKNIFANVTYKKQTKLKVLVQLYLFKQKSLERINYRIDVVGVILNPVAFSLKELVHVKSAVGNR